MGEKGRDSILLIREFVQIAVYSVNSYLFL